MKEELIDMDGFKDRFERLKNNGSGQWETTSQDFMALTNNILEYEVERTKLKFSCSSIYAIIPLLSSAVKCLYLEMMSFRNFNNKENQKIEFNRNNELIQIAEKLNMSEDFLRKINLFVEIRNEIIHPVHYPVNDKDNLPDYLRTLGIENVIKDKTSTPLLRKIRDWAFIKWTFQVIEELALKIIAELSETDDKFPQFEKSYRYYRELLKS